MTTILIRTIIIYAALMMIMRFMGKRQLGELEISDLVTTLLISEIASLPLTNTETPLSHAIIPILTLMSFEVILSGALLKIPALKRILTVRPTILIRHGAPDPAAMRSVRISTEELLSQLRQKDVTDPDEVEYAILESNGQISVVKKKPDPQPVGQNQNSSKPLPKQGKKSTASASEGGGGMMHLLVSDGRIHARNLALAGRDQRWLEAVLLTHRLKPSQVFWLLADDAGQVRIFAKEGKKT